jgi:hypothetical protein
VSLVTYGGNVDELLNGGVVACVKVLCRALVAQQFAESLHLASAAVSMEAGTGFVPAFEVAKANPMGIAAVRGSVLI